MAARARVGSFRQDIITALCLAFVMEGADRARATVFAALRQLIRDNYHYKWDVEAVLVRLYDDIVTYQREFQPSGFGKRIAQIEELAKRLNIALPGKLTVTTEERRPPSK